ncbi:MAG: NifU family protein [Myxococcota bacterium]
MGLFSTVLNSLGLRRPLRVREPGPPTLGPSGQRRLQSLDSNTKIKVTATPQDGGWLAQVDEGPTPDAHYDELEPGFWVHSEHRAHLKGMTLNHDGHRWTVSVSLTVHGAETPNPDGRLYKVDRALHYGRPFYVTRSMSGAPLLAKRLLADPGVISILLRNNTVTVERKETVSWDHLDRHVDASLRDHFLLGGSIVDGAGRPVRDDPLEEEVVKLIEAEVLPAIHRDGGNLTVQRVEDGVVYVTLEGACASCPASVLTLKGGVERALKHAFPGEITRVEAL